MNVCMCVGFHCVYMHMVIVFNLYVYLIVQS